MSNKSKPYTGLLPFKKLKELQPYLGPRPYEQKDRDLFFGRDREIYDLKSLVTAYPVVLLYAQSGAGKTSLLNAGLIPALEQKKKYEVLPVVRIGAPLEFQMGKIPNIFVFNTLLKWAKADIELERLKKISVASFFKDQTHPVDEDDIPYFRIAIFDQFEEIFTLHPERWKDRNVFFHQIAEALRSDPLLRVLFVIREDYIANLDPYIEDLQELDLISYRMERLRRDASCEAVEGPLKGTDYTYAGGVAINLVEQLLKIRVEKGDGKTVEINGEYVEPVQLQIVCETLWFSLPEKVKKITSDHLQTFGDVDEALKGFYEAAVKQVEQDTGVKEEEIREWFSTKLITPAGTRGLVFGDKTETEGMPNSVVNQLENIHIIRAEMRAGSRWYEITHDRYITPILKSNEIKKLAAEKQRYTADVQIIKKRIMMATYYKLRSIIGLLGIALPFVLSLGALILFQTGLQSSISGYYHTRMQDVFVGILCVIGFFLFSYKGYKRSDNIASNLACVSAVGIALFPTAPEGAAASGAYLIGYFHLAFLLLFFLTQIYISLFLFTKTAAPKSPQRRKLQRNSVYKACGYTMGICMLLITINSFLSGSAASFFEAYKPVLWLEFLIFFAFGISWLTKGEAIFKDKA